MQLKGTAGRELPQAENKRMLKVYALHEVWIPFSEFRIRILLLAFPFHAV